jgi:hypothetical protein|tara:strand:- start:140 stop:535 length:396 start_codon:yes stop_codon:yes gene_type:complete
MPGKKQRKICGTFNDKDGKLIDDACTNMGINKNQMIHEAVNLWLQFRPGLKEFQNTKFLNVMKKIQKIQTEIMNSPKMKKAINKIEKDFDKQEIESFGKRFGEIEKVAKEVSRKKKQGRPVTKKKRINRIE